MIYILGFVWDYLCIEYCCHTWSSAPPINLKILVKIQRWIFNVINPDLVSRRPTWFGFLVCFLLIFLHVDEAGILIGVRLWFPVSLWGGQLWGKDVNLLRDLEFLLTISHCCWRLEYFIGIRYKVFRKYYSVIIIINT